MATSGRFGFGRLSVGVKCALIGLPFLVPIIGLLYQVVSQNNKAIAIAESELQGLDYLRVLRQLPVKVAEHRGLTNRVKNGDKTAEADRAKVAGQVADIVAEVDKVDAKLGTRFRTPETKRWAKAKDEWAKLTADLGGLDAAAAFQRHTDLITGLLELVTDVWEFSTLALDPIAETYYLQDVMIARVIPSAEDLGQLRGESAGVIAKNPKAPTLTEDNRIRFSVLVGQIEGVRAAVDKEVRRAAEADPSLKGKLDTPVQDYSAKIDAFLAKVRLLLAGENPGVSAAEQNALGTAAIAAGGKLYEDADPLLVGLLERRASGYRWVNYYAIAATLAGLTVVAVVAFAVARNITGQVRNLTTVFDRIEAGDYKTRAAVLSADELGQMTAALNRTLDKTLVLIQSSDEKDEIQRSIMKLLEEVGGVADGDLTRDAEVTADMTGAIADSFNHMIDQLRKIIGSVQNTSIQVSTAANQIHASSDHLAKGSESQAEQIVNTSAAIDEMAVSIQQVSENAVTSSTVAQQALTNAKQGNAAVRNTIDGMNRIREQAQETAKRIKRLGETTQEIGQIVQLIDDIADRTSILALNASIQAAAAGDAGRGFGVVAEEVERLAVRSTEATKKIAALVKAIQSETTEAVAAMERNIQEVVGGSKVANQAGQSLAEIEAVSVRLAELIQSISLAAKQQARGSDALSKAMSEISRITQQTASGTKQTAESVSDLAGLADALRGSVSKFKLPDHSRTFSTPSSLAGSAGGNGVGNGRPAGAIGGR